jgi:hypothetical protein
MQPKIHGHAVQSRAEAVRYDIDNDETLAREESLHELSGSNSPYRRARFLSDCLEPMPQKLVSDPAAMTCASDHAPGEIRNIFGVHGPTSARNNTSLLLGDKVRPRKFREKRGRRVAIRRHEELGRVSFEYVHARRMIPAKVRANLHATRAMPPNRVTSG